MLVTGQVPWRPLVHSKLGCAAVSTNQLIIFQLGTSFKTSIVLELHPIIERNSLLCACVHVIDRPWQTCVLSPLKMATNLACVCIFNCGAFHGPPLIQLTWWCGNCELFRNDRLHFALFQMPLCFRSRYSISTRVFINYCCVHLEAMQGLDCFTHTGFIEPFVIAGAHSCVHTSRFHRGSKLDFWFHRPSRVNSNTVVLSNWPEKMSMMDGIFLTFRWERKAVPCVWCTYCWC